MKLIRITFDIDDHAYRLLDVLTLFCPKRSVYFFFFLLFVTLACGDASREISGVYETTISTSSDFATDSLVSAAPSPSDSLAQASSDSIPSEASAAELSSTGSRTAEAPGRTLLLELHEDHRAELKTSFLNNAPAIVQKGSWSLLDNDRVRTYFVEKDGRFFLDTLTFYRDGLRLVLRGKRSDITDEVNLMRVN